MNRLLNAGLFLAVCLIGCGGLVPPTINDLHAVPLSAKFGFPLDAGDTLKDSSSQFLSRIKEIRERLIDELVIREVPFANSREIVNALQSGQIEFAVLSASVFPAAVGRYVTGSDMEATRSRQDSEVGAYELAQLEKDELVGLTFWNTAPNPIVSKSRISDLGDLKGKKIIAFTKATQEILSAIGAQSLTVPRGQVFMAMQQGSADAAEMPIGDDFYHMVSGAGINSVISDLAGASEHVVVARKAFWIALPYRAQVEMAKALREAAVQTDRVSEESIQKGFQTISTKGLNVVRFAARDRAKLQEASYSIWKNKSRDVEILQRAFAATSAKREPSLGVLVKVRQERIVYFATVRQYEGGSSPEVQFGNRLYDDGPYYGIAKVSLNSGRRIGDDLEKAAIIDSVDRFTAAGDFVSIIQKELNTAANKQLLVLVHGYNNSFPDAIRRAAQFATDIDFAGPVIAFSWPSDGTALLYFHDEDRIPATQLGFSKFMAVLDDLVPRSSVNILAHSMGSRVVLDYTHTQMLSGGSANQEKYRSITFAASDAQVEYFRIQRDFLSKASGIVTVYFSENDRALWLSNKIHQCTRLGSTQCDLLFIEPETKPLGNSDFDFVNAAQIDQQFFPFTPRHSYIFDKEPGVTDIKMLLSKAMRAGTRCDHNPGKLTPKENGGGRFWELSQ
ncbi:MAG: TRAP transporter substrate-binding protein DctP [Desulfobacterales bacterium]